MAVTTTYPYQPSFSDVSAEISELRKAFEHCIKMGDYAKANKIVRVLAHLEAQLPTVNPGDIDQMHSAQEKLDASA